MRSCVRVAKSTLVVVGLLILATANARADGIVVRGETLLLGAAPPALSLEAGRTVDLSRLIQAVDPQPPYRANDLLVYDLSTRETTLGNASTTNRSLLAELGGGAILLGSVLDEPGDILYYESSPTGPDDFVHAERFLLVDAFDGGLRLWSNPALPVPEPSSTALLAAGVAALAAVARRPGRRARA